VHHDASRLHRGTLVPVIVAITLTRDDGVAEIVSASLSIDVPRRGLDALIGDDPARAFRPMDPSDGTLLRVPRRARADDGRALPDWGALRSLLTRAAAASPATRAVVWEVLPATSGPRIVGAWDPREFQDGGRSSRILDRALSDPATGASGFRFS
jgi:hypothetical protein